MKELSPKELLAIVLLVLLFLGQCGYLVSFHTITDDEHIHTAAGILYLRTGLFEGGFDNPPLIQLLYGLPYHLNLSQWQATGLSPPYAARYVNMFLGLFLCLLIGLFSLRLHGTTGGLISLCLAVTSPSIIAHSSITTLDTGLALFLVGCFYFLYESHCRGKRWFSLVAALFLGLAASAKYTIILLFPYVILLIVAAHWLYDRKWTQIVTELLLGAFIVWFIISALFLFKGCFAIKGSGEDGFLLKMAKWLSPTGLIQSLQNKFSQAATSVVPHSFLGKLQPVDIRFYVGVLLFKVLPGTLLMVIPFIYYSNFQQRLSWQGWLYTVLPAALFWLFFNFNNTYCGIRHLLPILGFIFIAFGKLGKDCIQSQKGRNYLLFLLALNLFASLHSFPYHMAYFNILGQKLSSSPFVIGTSDSDYGQEDNALKRALVAVPTDHPLLLCPTPSMHPRIGYLAVNGQAVTRENGYPWLDYFKPQKRIGGSWLLYYLPEREYERLSKSGSWEHLRLYLFALLNERMYERALAVGRQSLAKHPKSWPYVLQSLIYQGRAQECLKLEVPPQFKRWQAIAIELLGRGRGRKVEQHARAMLSLIELSSFHSFPFRKAFFASPDGFSKMRNEKNFQIMQFVGLQLFDERKFANALPYMRATMGRDKRTVVNEIFVKITKSKNMDDTVLGVVHGGPFAYHGAVEIMAQLKRFHKQNPDSYWVIIGQHYLRVLQRRGMINANLGFGSLFDRVNEMGHHQRQNDSFNESAHK